MTSVTGQNLGPLGASGGSVHQAHHRIGGIVVLALTGVVVVSETLVFPGALFRLASPAESVAIAGINPSDGSAMPESAFGQLAPEVDPAVRLQHQQLIDVSRAAIKNLREIDAQLLKGPPPPKPKDMKPWEDPDFSVNGNTSYLRLTGLREDGTLHPVWVARRVWEKRIEQNPSLRARWKDELSDSAGIGPEFDIAISNVSLELSQIEPIVKNERLYNAASVGARLEQIASGLNQTLRNVKDGPSETAEQWFRRFEQNNSFGFK